MRRRWLAAVVAGVVVVAAGAFVAVKLVVFAPAEDDAIKLVPEDSAGYFNVFLRPSNSQRRALEGLISKTPFETPEKLINKVTDLIDRGLEGRDCSFEEDFEPWLGKQIAGFLDGFGPAPDGAVLVSVEDGDAALEALDKCSEGGRDGYEDKSYEGIDYRVYKDDEAAAVVESFLVLGTEDGLHSVIDTASDGESLDKAIRYRDAVKGLPDDLLALGYLDTRELVESLQASGALPPGGFGVPNFFFNFTGDRPLTISLFARSDGIVLDYASGLPADSLMASTLSRIYAPGLLPELPDGSWGAFGFGDAGAYVDVVLDSLALTGFPGFNRDAIEKEFRKQTGLSLRDDVLSWMGDLGMFVRGTSLPTLEGGVVIETSDEKTSQATLTRLARLASVGGAAVRPLDIPNASGFSIRDAAIAKPINFAGGNGRVVAAYGNAATKSALATDDTLGETDEFQEAVGELGEDFAMTGFFAVDPIQQFAEGAAPSLDEQYTEDVRPFIDALSYVAVGSRIEAEVVTQRLVIGVEDDAVAGFAPLGAE